MVQISVEEKWWWKRETILLYIHQSITKKEMTMNPVVMEDIYVGKGNEIEIIR
jgi:hypothetical protein